MTLLVRLKVMWEIFKSAFTTPNKTTRIHWDDASGKVWVEHDNS